MPDYNTAGRHFEVAPGPSHPGGVIHFGLPTPAAEDEPEPMITGDEGAALIQQLHQIGAHKGYERVRLDRGTHPYRGDHYELGWVHGEVTARFSHRPNLSLRRTQDADLRFEDALAENARAVRP